MCTYQIQVHTKLKTCQEGKKMDSDELPDLEEKHQVPKSEEVHIIPDDSTTGSESGNSSFIFKPTTAKSNTLSTGTATTNATVDYFPVV